MPHHSFKLSEDFITKYANTHIPWTPIGEFTYLRTYSRVKDDGTKERWHETIRRVVEGTFEVQRQHCESLRLSWNSAKAQNSAKIMYDKMFNFKFLPSGRGLWMMGTQFVKERGSLALNSCAGITTEDILTRGSFAFTWTMDALMLGVGVGFDTKGADKLAVHQPKPDGTFIIPDSREGWVESLGVLLDAFFLGKPLPIFDYSHIRPYGAAIKGFGGVASGPEPLQTLHTSITALLTQRVGHKLTSVDIVDIMNMIGVCVVAGNVRRSATISLGSWNDRSYTTMKDYNLHPQELQSHRWASNNSVFAECGKTDYVKFVDSIALNGEPGLIWLENMQAFSRMDNKPDYKDKHASVVNPCGEQTLQSAETCNLVETFPSNHESYAEYKETLKSAYLYGKTVTLIPTHWPETNAVILKNRRLGLSQSGIIDAFVKHGRHAMLHDWCDQGYTYIQELDKIYSDWLCIPRSIKTTTVKPSGTVSLLAGVNPGIHYPHAKYYIRRIRVAADSPLTQCMREAGYNVHEEVSGNANKKTSVIDFPMHDAYFSKRKADVSIWEQVKNAVDYQRYWSDNNVSITVTFLQQEKRDIVPVLEAFEQDLKAISFLPMTDHGYKLAPYEEISKDLYDKLMERITPVDFSRFIDDPEGTRFCDGGTCQL